MHPQQLIDQYPDYFQTKEARIHFFANDWEHVSAEFHRIVKEYYDAMFQLSLILCHIVEFCFSLQHNSLVEETDRHTSILSLNYYPPLPLVAPKKDKNRLEEGDERHAIERIAEHTDVSMFTIVTELGANDEICDYRSDNDNVQLEIYNTLEERWESVKYDPGMFLVNVGDCLHDRSGNRLLSALHRVVMYATSNSDEAIMSNERYSTAFFFSPNYDAKMNWPMIGLCPEETEVCLDYDTWRKERVKRAMEKLKKTSAPALNPPSKKALAKAAKKAKEAQKNQESNLESK